MTVKEMQTEVDAWIQAHGVRYFNELTNLAVLMEEVGEFARLVARQFGEQSFKQDTDPGDIQECLSDEIADVLFVLTCLANQMHIDLEAAFLKSLEKKTQRDHHRHQRNPKLR